MSPYRWHVISLFGATTLVVLLFFTLSVWKKSDDGQNTAANVSAPTSLAEPIVTFVDPSRGAATAPVTVVIFGDYGCAACATTDANLETLRRSRPNDFRVVWKDLPNRDLHPYSVEAVTAARCAGAQGKFWEYHDELLAMSSQLTPLLFTSIAQRSELNMESWQACYASSEYIPVIEKTIDEATRLGITATPALFIGTDRMEGQMSLEALQTWIRPHLSPTP